MAAGKGYDVKDLKLAAAGRNRVEWAKKDMPVLRSIGARFVKEKPLRGVRIAACLHVTTETAALMQVLAAGGAKVALCASNPLSTQDEAAASLVKNDGVAVYAIKGENRKTAALGHFGRELPEFTWEKIDKVRALRKAAGHGA